MKLGCLLLLGVLGFGFYGYWSLLQGTELHADWWIPLLLAFGAAMLVGNIQGIIQSLRQIRASKRPPSAWKEGMLVVLSGKLQALGTPITAPVSGNQATIVEYEVIRQSQSDDSPSSTADYRGCLMAPCGIQTNQGPVRLIGFPLLTKWQDTYTQERESFRRLAKFMLANPCSQMPKSPIAALAELNKILKDEDGDVHANYRTSGVLDLREIVADATGEELEDKEPLATPPEAKIEEEHVSVAVDHFIGRGYRLKETSVPNNTEVTAIGTYRAQKRQIDIGSGFSNLAHGLFQGKSTEVLSKNFSKSVVITVIILAGFLMGNYYLLQKIGIDVTPVLNKVRGVAGF